jgi:hypothetical protein
MHIKSSSRSSKGQFKKGASGNPTGRPPGSRNKGTLACEQLLDDECEELIVKAMQMARKGNIHALRLCLERILPVRKERCIHLDLRPVTSAQDLPLQYQDISTAVAEGRITPGEGESISNILSSPRPHYGNGGTRSACRQSGSFRAGSKILFFTCFIRTQRDRGRAPRSHSILEACREELESVLEGWILVSSL